jgi:D-alanyl-D-alanine carboxypeptidase/D-alanyl-D-alanine-endopeptidase (penicillin-binding protein 4)
VAIPTALTFRGNVGPQGRHIDDPELRAAADLTAALRRHGVQVVGGPKAARASAPLVAIADVSSSPIAAILRRMSIDSNNFDAEVLGKYLGAGASHVGSIRAAAAAIHAYAAAIGVRGFVEHDASGLSYADRMTSQGMVRLLWSADRQPWASDLRATLPTGGQGTLTGRLLHVRVRAKTGTLTDISALSGWVWSKKAGGWVEFSILSAGMTKEEAVRIEDAIVRLVSAKAAHP